MQKNTLEFCVYKITNSISGKSYIGKTKDLNRRWKGHKSSAKRKNTNSKFPRALRKYSEDTWNISILYETDDENHCYQAEILLIDDYDTLYTGYNSTDGGLGFASGKNNPMYGIKGKDHPTFGKNGMLNKHHSKETLKLMSIATSGENNPNFGNTWSQTEESKKLISIATKGENNPMFGKSGKDAPGYGVLPWNTGPCKSKGLDHTWLFLDKVYMLRNDKGSYYGPARLYDYLIKIYPTIKYSKSTFQNMIKWIKENGDPSKNEDWLRFSIKGLS